MVLELTIVDAELPRRSLVYGNLLLDLTAKHDVDCWLVNTGWIVSIR